MSTHNTNFHTARKIKGFFFGFFLAENKCLIGTKLGIVKLILQTTGSISLLVDDSFIPEDITSSVPVPQC